MTDKYLEPAAFVFPLPDNLKEHYLKWYSEKPQGENGDQLCTPVFIPVYPAYPGLMPFPSFCQENPPGSCPCGGTAYKPPGINPFILFLILILLVIIFKKEEIASVIRKLMNPEKNPA